MEKGHELISLPQLIFMINTIQVFIHIINTSTRTNWRERLTFCDQSHCLATYNYKALNDTTICRTRDISLLVLSKEQDIAWNVISHNNEEMWNVVQHAGMGL